MAILSKFDLSYEFNEKDEEQIEQLLPDAAAIIEDTLGEFFGRKSINNITFDVSWNNDSTIKEGTLLREIGLQPTEEVT